MDTKKKAPVQGCYHTEIPHGEVPWCVHALAAEAYNKHYSQSAEQLANRGGFSWAEIVAGLRGEFTMEGCEKARADLLHFHNHPEGAKP